MNFKLLREEQLKLTQEELAQLIKVDVNKVIEWENTNEPELNAIIKIAQKTGLDFNTVLNYSPAKIEILNVKNTWESVDFTRKSIGGYISQALKEMNITTMQREKYIEGLLENIQNNVAKPVISIVGRSDTGKSTLINALIGMDKMPTAWTPTTSIAVYIKHLSDRPDFIKDEAWIFADEVDGEELWNSKKLYDKQYCEKWKMASGNIELLRSFGTRQGEMFEKNAGSAVVFLDAPILKVCDIIDLPGFGTDKISDDTITFKMAQKTDVLIYLSQANGFMRIEDINYLKENIRILPVWERKNSNELEPLSNLFVVASQAHTVSHGNMKELSTILQKGYENFNKSIAPEYWNKRKEESGYTDIAYSEKYMAKRFFTYTIDIPDLCNTFNQQLQKVLEALPKIIDNRLRNEIRKYVEANKPKLVQEIKKYEEIKIERSKYVELLRELDDNALTRERENTRRKSEIHQLIGEWASDSKKQFMDFCYATLNVDTITSMMKDEHITNKKEDIECFAVQLQDVIQTKCETILENKNQEAAVVIQEYINKYNNDLKLSFDEFDIDVEFDAGWAFASSLAKLGVVGGLGAWLVGEAAFMLGSLSFVMGTGGTIALGAASFGPIGLLAGIVLSLGLGALKLFRGGWEKNVAKKIIETFEKNNILGEYNNYITQYWKQTDDAFEKAAKEMENEQHNYIESLRKTVNEYDVEKIENDIKSLKEVQAFFEKFPL